MRKPGWQTKLTGLIGLVLGVLLLFQLLYVIPHVKAREVLQEQTHQEEIVRNIARKLDSDLTEPRDRLIGISGRAEFAGMDIASQQRTLDSFTEGSRRVMSMTVMNAEGWVVVASGVEGLSMLTTRSYADEPYFRVPFEQGDVHYQEPRFYPSEQLLSVAVSMPIESDTGERVGVLLGTLNLNHVVEMVAGYPLGEGMEIIVVDTEGTVVVHSGIDLFALEEGPLSLNYRHDTIVQAIMAGEIGVPPEHDHDGVSYYGIYTMLESNGWGVLMDHPMSLILAEANALSRWMLTANAILFAIALLIALLLARQIMAGERKAVRVLSESEEKFRALFEQSMDAINTCAPDGSSLDANQAWLDLFGYSRDELPGLNAADIYANPEDREDFVRRIAEAGLVEDEVRLKKKDGTIMDCRRTSVARKDERGNTVAYQGIVHDITAWKLAQEELRSSERTARALLDATSDAVFLLKPDGTIVDANRTFAAAMGSDTIEQMVGTPLWGYGTPDSAPAGKARLLEAVTSGKPVTYEDEWMGRTVACVIYPIVDDEGVVSMCAFFARDTTVEKRLNAALQASTEQFRLLTQRVEEVREEERTGLARELHDTAGQAVTALKLDVSRLKKRLEQGQAPTPEELGALNDLLDRTADDVRRISSELRPGVLDDIGLDGAIEWQIDELKKRTDLDCTVSLPPVQSQLDDARRTALFRVFQELLTNVVRHAEARSVHVTLERTDSVVTLTVADDGCGVDPEKLDDSSAIGIIGMRERLRPYGGELHYDSAPGRGTTARVVMPAE